MSTHEANEITKFCRMFYQASGIFITPYFFDKNHRNKVTGFTLNFWYSYKVSLDELYTRIQQLADSSFKHMFINVLYQRNHQEVHMLWADSEEDYKEYIVGQLYGKLCGDVVEQLGTGSSISVDEYRKRRTKIMKEGLPRYVEHLDPMFKDLVLNKIIS